MFKHLVFVTFLIVLLSACSSRAPLPKIQKEPVSIVVPKTINQRNQQMQQLLHWSITGKIAFIEKKKRQSASLKWTYKHSNKNKLFNDNFQQQIDLTTFLGINILHVESNNKQHLIKVDGKKYQGDNLNEMVYRLTGLLLPDKALNFWLKGIAYTKTDQLTYQESTPLPLTLYSNYYQQQWYISYNKFKLFKGYQLPTRLTIKQGDLTIKIAINQWSIL